MEVSYFRRPSEAAAERRRGQILTDSGGEGHGRREDARPDRDSRDEGHGRIQRVS